ncbi:SDR family NAD(P)-dependent oxidoreductase [Spirillospora sp. NPDC029432]|uniref:SDR family NAD(P)-dependent oxidoreductase n=1 Tax=Spirillospora sp. NPDC029432 TaxID=3154599 RepID=UPI0034546712
MSADIDHPPADAARALRGKVAVVTGAGGGIGRYIAQSLGEAGASVAIGDVDESGLEESRALLAASGIPVIARPVDVTSEAQLAELMAATAKAFGGIDISVNNAAIVTHSHWKAKWPDLDEMPRTFWDKVIDTNVGGVYLTTKHVAPYLRARGGGHVINLYGGGPLRPGTGAYALSKDAVAVFTRHSAVELEPDGICVLCVDPGGAIATDDAPDEIKARYPGVDSLEDLFVQAASAPMNLTGEKVMFPREGAKVLAPVPPNHPPQRRIMGYDPYALAPPTSSFTLVSDDFKNGGAIPFECYADDRGKNASPSLKWYDLPDGTESLVITAYDADTPIPGGIWHWLVKDVPVSGPAGELLHGAAPDLPAPAVALTNDLGQAGYSGMRPPPFSGMHHIYFCATALKVPTLEIPDDATIAQAHIMMIPHTLGRAVLVGTSVAP